MGALAEKYEEQACSDRAPVNLGTWLLALRYVCLLDSGRTLAMRLLEKQEIGKPPGVQGLGLFTSTTVNQVQFSVQGAKIPRALWRAKKKKRKIRNRFVSK